MEHTYVGYRGRDGVAFVECDRKRLSPAASQKVRNHSPDGFEWGYGGSGPAQLALALLLNEYPDREELVGRLYQKFKFERVGALPQTSSKFDQSKQAFQVWRMTSAEIREWFETKAAAHSAATN